MRKWFLTALTGALPFAGDPAEVQSRSVQGVWKTVEIAFPGPNGRTMTNLQANLSVFAAQRTERGPMPNAPTIKAVRLE